MYNQYINKILKQLANLKAGLIKIINFYLIKTATHPHKYPQYSAFIFIHVNECFSVTLSIVPDIQYNLMYLWGFVHIIWFFQ